MTHDEQRAYLIRRLAEDANLGGITVPEDAEWQKHILRSLMNVRMPKAVDPEVLAVQDEYLEEEIRRKGITDIADLEPVKPGSPLYLWKGDITTLKCGAIVNAANSGMLGCFQPCHNCIDNCIHTYAGMQLRLECAYIMRGAEEPVGRARITKAYNLPCDYVIHTVGPMVQGTLADRDRKALASCYRSCLDTAVSRGVQSIAFCCISTGVFSFPQEEAARIAVHTVQEYLKVCDVDMKVIFNVFSQRDYAIYDGLLRV